MSQPSPPHAKQSAVDIKTRIQKYQQATATSTNTENQTDGVTKSKSFHDLRCMTLTGEDGGWVMATEGRIQREASPLLPPKPPTRKKKFTVEPSDPAPPPMNSSANSDSSPSNSPKITLRSTDLFILKNTKPIPPRPPPPYTKPTRRNTEKRQHQTSSHDQRIPEEGPSHISSNTVHSSTPESNSFTITKTTPSDISLGDSRDRKSSGADTKSSEETSSLSDSVEEDKTPKLYRM